MARTHRDTHHLPYDPTTGLCVEPMAQPGYYPGYSTLSQQDFWDEATRKLILERVNNPPPIRFFTGCDGALMAAVCGRVLPQSDRDDAYRIPLLNYIDDKVYHNRIPGYRYDNMPPMQEAYRLGLAGIDAIAVHLHGQRFVDLGTREQDEVLKTLHDGKPPAGDEIWQRLPVAHFWTLLMQDAIEAYYAHPYAWDEIGYGGPAYPRGYMRLRDGQPEPYEKPERRYAWTAPVASLSGEIDPAYEAPPHPQMSNPAGGEEGSH